MHGRPVRLWKSAPVNWMEQVNAYEATFCQFYNEPWMAGICWWFWPADPWESRPCDRGYFSAIPPPASPPADTAGTPER